MLKFENWNDVAIQLVENVSESTPTSLTKGVTYDDEKPFDRKSSDSNTIKVVAETYPQLPEIGASTSSNVMQTFWELEMKECKRLKEKENDLNLVADFNESERERRKAEIEVIIIDDEGALSVQTKNTRLLNKERRLANFRNPKLMKVINAETKAIGFLLSVTLGEREEVISINEKELVCGDIILRKLNAHGADFLTDKSTRKKKYMVQLIIVLLRQDMMTLYVPNKRGWYINASNELKFCKEERKTWKKIFY